MVVDAVPKNVTDEQYSKEPSVSVHIGKTKLDPKE